MKRKWKCEKVRSEPLCAKRCLKIQAVKTQSHSLVMCEQELPKFVAHACTVLGAAAGCEGSCRTTQDFVNTRASVPSFYKTVELLVQCAISQVLKDESSSLIPFQSVGVSDQCLAINLTNSTLPIRKEDFELQEETQGKLLLVPD